MPKSFSPLRPVEDVGPNEIVGGLSAGNHWRGARPSTGMNPLYDGTLDAPLLLSFDDPAGEKERFRLELKPNDFASIVNVKIFLIQSTAEKAFDPASGFMEFPISLYRGDNTTLIASTTAHIANDYNPVYTELEYVEGGPYWHAQEYDLGAVTISPANAGTGLIVELDSTEADGWGDGTDRSWDVYAIWAEVEYTETEDPDTQSIVEGHATIRAEVVGYSPIGECTGDSPIEAEIVGSSVFEQES